MNGKPRTAIFKQKIAIEALKSDRTINEIAKEYGVHPVQVSQWKKELIDGANVLFGKRKKKDGTTEVEKDWLLPSAPFLRKLGGNII